MTRVMIESHPSSKTPSAYVPVLERLDLTMPKSALQKPHKFTCAHLNYLECRGESIFANEKSINLFMNVLRLHWKVSGNILRHAADQGNDLHELLILKLDGVFIIRDLLTVDTTRQLLGRETPDAMVVLATVVHDIYTAQWQNWSHEQNVKHTKKDQYALIISHAQAISNQFSNNVLAFRGKNAPELRKWAEMTVANHLMAIITPGHLPREAPRPSDYLFKTRVISGLDSVKPIIDQVGSNNALEPGPVNEHDQVQSNSIPRKRTAIGHDTDWQTSPSKRIKVKADGPGRSRAYDTYRPSAYKGPASVNVQPGFRGPAFRNFHNRHNDRRSRDLLTTPSPLKLINRHERQAPDTPTHEQLRRDKLRELELMIADHEYNAIAHLDYTAAGSKKSDGIQEPTTPVVKGPSYTKYLRKKETDTKSPLTAIKVRTTGHFRTQSYIGSEEGEILE